MEKNCRHYGIDLLRILSMLFVVVLHMVGHGGILAAASRDSINYQTAWLLNISAYCAVNCYVLISGYVGVHASFKYANILNLWLQVFLYSIGIAAVFQLLSPQTINWKQLIIYGFPVIFGRYWYFTSYFILFFMMPLLNAAINHITKTQAKTLVCSIFILFSLLPIILRCNFPDIPMDYLRYVDSQNGFSVWWFILLYIIGGCIRRFGLLQQMKKRALLAIYIGCVMLTWGFKFWGEHSNQSFFADNLSPNLLFNYSSPTILLSAIALLAIFAQMDSIPRWACRGIGFLAPVSFGVYLIHDHPLVRQFLVSKKLAGLVHLHPLYFIFSVLAIVLSVYLLCSLIDYVRLLIFKGLRIKPRIEGLLHYLAGKRKADIAKVKGDGLSS